MEDGDAVRGPGGSRKQRYEDEDLSPTTKRELRGFYAYSLAAEVYAVVGVGSFLPVTLEQLARERGVLWSDRTTSCVAKKTAENASSTLLRFLTRATEPENNTCVIRVLGTEITTSSFAMYTFSLAVFVQAIALVSFSAVADHGTYRKKLLLGFGFTGAISSMLFLPVVPSIFLVAPILVIIGVTCLGSSFVILNSFLPLLVANHPPTTSDYDFQNASTVLMEPMSPGSSPNRDSFEFTPEHNNNNNSKSKTDSPELKLSNAISSKGVGIGYIAAVFVQILSILLLFTMSKTNVSSTLPLRMVLFLAGSWWFFFTIPASRWLRARPGPPLKTAHQTTKLRSFLAYISFSWLSLFRTIKLALKLRQVCIFLIAWFLLSDAIATISGTAILFARTELHLSTPMLALLSITATCSGILGTYTIPLISHRFRLTTHQTLLCLLCLQILLPIYALIPIFFPSSPIGLIHPWEIYPLALLHGYIMGGLSSLCRSFFTRLIPRGKEVGFFALYAVTDKGSSALGPAVVGVVTDRWGGIRVSFFVVLGLVILAGSVLWWVDVEKGVRGAAVLERELEVAEEGERMRGRDRGNSRVGAEGEGERLMGRAGEER